ncbi:MAG: HIT family protein [Myxococcales bacterium]|nr:HIT family protein [Myxococcales bacterium]
MAETIFSRILRGEIPCHRVYEDERVFAFLDINPIAPGHTLVIPKAEVTTLDLLEDEDAAALGRALPRICRAVLAATGTTDFNVLENNGRGANQAIDHVHFHIIPRAADGRGLRTKWLPGKLEADEAKALAAAISEKLQG